jgi:hypothetical protein
MPDAWDDLPVTLRDAFLPLVVDRATLQLVPGEILY